MAHNTILEFSASGMFGDSDAQLVTGDAIAVHDIFKGRPVLSFDDTDEEAALTPEVPMPGQYAGGTLKADIHFFMETDNINDIALDVFVEAKTPNSDNLDLKTAISWDIANSGTQSLAGSTAGDPRLLTITLTNKDNVVAGDLVRFGVRRDCDSANDDASGDLYIAGIDVWEDTA